MNVMKRWIYLLWKGRLLGDVKELDLVSKYLVMTRAVIDIITVISASIGALLALLTKSFDPLIYVLCLIGLLLMHSGADLMNDYFDYKNGIDTKDYFRAKYLPHPILEDLITPRGLALTIIAHFLIASLIAVYLTILRGPIILLFYALGLLFGFLYQEGLKLKYFGLGEISTLIVWGPLMVGGTYFAMTGHLDNSVILASIPYGLMVMLILFGKHIDKHDSDKAKGVRTLPVILGAENAKKLAIVIALLSYILIPVLIVLNILPLLSSLVFLTIPSLYVFIKVYLSKRSDVYYVGVALWLNRHFGISFVVGLLLSYFI